jgi:hypothetical protein
MPQILPTYTTPEELAQHLGVAERTLRERIRKLGAYRLLGNRMLLLEGDVNLLLEDMKPCPSKSTSAVHSGTSEAPLPVGDYEELLERRTRQSRNGSQPRQKLALGVITSTAQKPA